MARQKLFEYAILYHPKEKKDVAGNIVNEKSKVVKPLTETLAADDKEVGIRAARELPEEYLDKIEDIEIIIRPL